jgi:hypothetical protein
MTDTIKIPQRLRKRPRFSGYVISYTTWVHPQTHVPDFKVNDETKRTRCIERGLCAMCGERLNREIVFIGGASLCNGALAVDAGMHPGCADYAWNVCPYIVTGRGHNPNPKLHGDGKTVFQIDLGIPDPPPDRMGKMLTYSYEKVEQGGKLFARPGPPIAVEWREFPHNKPHYRVQPFEDPQ